MCIRDSTLHAAIAAGDGEAKLAFEYLIEGASNAIRVLGLTLNPSSIVIGGGLRLLGAPLFDGIRETLQSREAESEFVAALELSTRLHVLPEGSPGAAVGAAVAVNE